MTFCDLHTHSNFSDGTLSPSQLISKAKEIGLSAIALTDHNTVLGLPEFLAAASEQGVLAIPGIELSTSYQDRELHILGLFIPPNAYDTIEELTNRYHGFKEASNQILIDNLHRAGYHIRYEDVKRRSKSGNVNRAHVAAELLEKGYIPSIKAAFEELLRPNGAFYQPPKRLDVFEAIPFLRDVGATPVLAHPFLEFDEAQLRAFLPRATDCGLVGMEVMHSTFSNAQSQTAQAIAREFSLAESGGSDFHGDNKPHVQLGKATEDQPIPYSIYERLLQRKV